jgi:phosphatidylserine decarboxylase
LITKYGYDVAGVVTVVSVAGSIASWQLIPSRFFAFTLITVFLLLLFFTLNFFRDPERVTPPGDGLIISPADGEVVLLQNVVDPEYDLGDAVQVSIFMSPLNVHVNRYPISGRVGYFRHIPGQYLVAFDDKSSMRNERTHIGVENPKVRVLFKQIAGFVARRIVAPIQVGDDAVAGERFGMIRFGSRVDVIMPRNVDMKVRLGDKTVAGETILAEIV